MKRNRELSESYEFFNSLPYVESTLILLNICLDKNEKFMQKLFRKIFIFRNVFVILT